MLYSAFIHGQIPQAYYEISCTIFVYFVCKRVVICINQRSKMVSVMHFNIVVCEGLVNSNLSKTVFYIELIMDILLLLSIFVH